MERRSPSTRTVSIASVKPFHVRHLDLRHTMEDKVVQLVWNAEFQLAEASTVAGPLYTILDRRETVSASGLSRWEYRGRY